MKKNMFAKTGLIIFSLVFCLGLSLEAKAGNKSTKAKLSKKLCKQKRRIRKNMKNGLITDQDYSTMYGRLMKAEKRVKALPNNKMPSKRKERRARQALANVGSDIYVNRLNRDTDSSPRTLKRAQNKRQRKDLKTRVRGNANGMITRQENQAIKNQTKQIQRTVKRAKRDGYVDEREVNKILEKKAYRTKLINRAAKTEGTWSKRPIRARSHY